MVNIFHLVLEAKAILLILITFSTSVSPCSRDLPLLWVRVSALCIACFRASSSVFESDFFYMPVLLNPGDLLTLASSCLYIQDCLFYVMTLWT